jgi:putative inorganic carbon (HCO3(-)) transporter
LLSNHKYHTYLFYFLLAIVFWIPIPLGSNRPWAWSIMQIMIFSLFIGCVWSQRRLAWLGLKEYRLPIVLWLCYLVLLALQIVPLPASLLSYLSPNAYALQENSMDGLFYLSVDYGQSQISLLKSVSYFCLFLVTLILIRDGKTIKTLLFTILIAATLQALYGAFEVLLGLKHSIIFNLPVRDIATGTFVYKNHFANYLMLGLSAGIGIMVATLQTNQLNNKRNYIRAIVNTLLSSKALVRICLVIMVIALVMSKSRMGNTAFFVSMSVCGFLALALIRNRNKSLTILIISMFVIDLFIVSAWFGLDKVQERLTQTSLSQETRDEVVRDALPIISDFPLFGTGGGSFYGVFPQYKKAEINGFYDHAHNDYLQMTIEHGIPASLLLAILVLLSLYKSLYAMRHRKNSIMKGTAFAVCMVIIGMLIHMTVDFPLQAPANAGYFVVFLALAWVINNINVKPSTLRNV